LNSISGNNAVFFSKLMVHFIYPQNACQIKKMSINQLDNNQNLYF